MQSRGKVNAKSWPFEGWHHGPQGEDERCLGVVTELQSWEVCDFRAEDFRKR